MLSYHPRVDITPEHMGALKIGIESESGVRMSPYATIVVAPAVVLEDVRSTRVFLIDYRQDCMNKLKMGYGVLFGLSWSRMSKFHFMDAPLSVREEHFFGTSHLQFLLNAFNTAIK